MAHNLENLQKLAQATFERGYKSSVPEGGATDYMAKGSRNMIVTGTGKTQVFKGAKLVAGSEGGAVMGNVAEDYASVGEADDYAAYGSVFNVFSALFFIGGGIGDVWLRLSGVNLAATAQQIMQLLVKRNGVYTDALSGPYQAGLPEPSAAIIGAVSPIAGLTGRVNGVVSVVIWRIRTATGAVSNKSPVSNIVGAVNQSISIKFPALGSNGDDAWGIGVTLHGEGRVGAHFELEEVLETRVASSTDVPGEDRTIVVEWTDGDLLGKDYAPFRSNPPPPALFAGSLEDIVFVDGAYADSADDGTATALRGTAIAPSEPGSPESFSPDTAIFTNDVPTALLRGNGVYWRFGKNSLYMIRYLGGDKPISADLAWQGTGIEFPWNACVAEGGRIYLWSSERGAMRMGDSGLPDSDFANDVADDLAVCTDPAKRVLGWDGLYKIVAYCYERMVFPWMAGLNVWGSPIDLTGIIAGVIKSCVTVDSQLLISDTLGNIYQFGKMATGSLGIVGVVRTPWVLAENSLETVAAVIANVRADNITSDVVIEVLADGAETVERSISVTPQRTGLQRMPSVRPNVIDCDRHAIQVKITAKGATSDVGIESVHSFGSGSSILI